MANNKVTTVLVQYVNQPKKVDGKYGNIKLKDGSYFQVPVDMLKFFSPGGTYEIEFTTQTWGDRDVEVVKKINHSAPQTSAAPTGGNAGGGGAPRMNDMMIFVTGVVGRAMGSGKFGPADVTDWTLAGLEAYRALNRRIAELKREAEEGPQDQGGED